MDTPEALYNENSHSAGENRARVVGTGGRLFSAVSSPLSLLCVSASLHDPYSSLQPALTHRCFPLAELHDKTPRVAQHAEAIPRRRGIDFAQWRGACSDQSFS